MTETSELSNTPPRFSGYAWIDMLPPGDRTLVDSLYLWAAITKLDGDTNLAEDLRKAAERIGALRLHRHNSSEGDSSTNADKTLAEFGRSVPYVDPCPDQTLKVWLEDVLRPTLTENDK